MTDKEKPDKETAASKPGDKPVASTPPVRPSVKEDTPPNSVKDPDPKAEPEDPYGEARLLRAQADAMEAAAPPTDKYVKLKVEPPHESFSFGGVTVGPDWTAVHASLVPGVLNSAAEASGVTITQEG